MQARLAAQVAALAAALQLGCGIEAPRRSPDDGGPEPSPAKDAPAVRDAAALDGWRRDGQPPPADGLSGGEGSPPGCGAGPGPVLGQTAWPVPSVKKVCQGFGNPISYQTCGFHTGIDICAADGAQLLAIADGKVVHVGYMWYSGATTGRGPYAIIIEHSPSFYSTYSHNRKALVQQGSCVVKGQLIGEVGSLGYSSGPHLHFEIVDGTAFTGNWQQPFASACTYYKDPLQTIKP